ncbi:lytic transglycosylase domain-containing protein [Oceanibium sediminis]|uniref:lytic transglycosylase domain-containing protein n=1 Tax=Oceanibium sediminis TaxID=2026339 RepID=UPI001E593416|nr:lytic transglycosylase domain-containing protein [Oceanibium sediminis]
MSRLIIPIAVALMALGAPKLALSEAAERDTPFKRVKPNASGGRNLINIQVEPVAPVERVLAYIPEVPPAPAVVKRIGPPLSPQTGETGWFWSELSPSITAADPDRLLTSVGVISRNSGATAAGIPRLSRLNTMAEKYGASILKATAGRRVSPALVLAVMSVESAGKPKAKSHAGAVGLMQLMPATAKRFGVTDRTDPDQSIRGGVEYLEFLLNEFGGDPLLALAGYNAGEGAVRKNSGVPNYAETRAYVPKVVAAWSQARLLCLNPPSRATDSCLFTGVRTAQR